MPPHYPSRLLADALLGALLLVSGLLAHAPRASAASFVHVTLPSDAGESDLSLQAVFPSGPPGPTPLTASEVDTVEVPLDDVIPGFDPSLGTLLEITVRLALNMQLGAEFVATDPLGGPVTMLAGGSIRLTGSADDASVGGSGQCTGTGSCSVVRNVSDPDLALHVGLFLPQDLPETLMFERTIVFSAFRLAGVPEITGSVEGSWSADLFVTYYYDPFVVPEPGTVLLLAMGFAALTRLRT